MNLTQLKVLTAVAEHGNFTRAAEALGQTQPAVSKTVRQLEQSLGGPLLMRGSGGVTSTALGDRVLAHARAALQEVDALRQMANGRDATLSGALRLACPPSLTAWPLPKILSAYRRRHPGVSIRLFEGDADEVKGWLADRFIDAAFFTSAIPGWDWTPFAEEDFVAIFSEADAPARSTVTLGELAGLPTIASSCGIERILASAFAAAGHAFEAAQRVRSYTTIFAMVEEGLGHAILPRSIADMAPPGLTAREIAEGPSRTIGLLTQHNRGRAADAFLDEARRVLAVSG